jgi:hypothetical protein
MTSRVSLAELAVADIRIRPAEAVAIVSEICGQYRSGRITAVPSPGVIRLTSDGQIVVEGPITTGPGSVARAAHLLNDLLADVDAPAQYRASGGLRLVIARALGTLDLPPYASLEDFCAALARFAVPDLAATAQTLYQAWISARAAREAAATAAPLTISDVRRARRATGLSLDDLAGVADIPVMRLRELEWGYMRHWRADAEGRDRVIRYARAAGLDERLVLSIAWPMIEDAALVHANLEPEVVTTLVPSGTQVLATLPFPSPVARARRPLRSWGLAAAGAAVLGVTTLVFGTDAAPPWDARAEATPAPAESRDAPPVPAPMASTRTPAPPVVPVPAKTTVRAPGTARPAVRAVTRPAPAPPQKRPSKRRSFFQRELFRIVIR